MSGNVVFTNTLTVVYVWRYDAYKRAQAARLAEQGIPLPSGWYRLSYFHCSLFGYFLGLVTATVTSEVQETLFQKQGNSDEKKPNILPCIGAWYW